MSDKMRHSALSLDRSHKWTTVWYLQQITEIRESFDTVENWICIPHPQERRQACSEQLTTGQWVWLQLSAKLIRERVMDHLNINDLISKYQHGFIKVRSCVTQLLATLDNWTGILDMRGMLDTVYLDFSKLHEKVLSKLKSYGISSTIWDWIADFLRNRIPLVSINVFFLCSQQCLWCPAVHYLCEQDAWSNDITHYHVCEWQQNILGSTEGHPSHHHPIGFEWTSTLVLHLAPPFQRKVCFV